ncbi:hypothetical protein EU527_10250 [Candidatus Thorarchaeota archaeon]|nr:MAG: hypothetical protein EU527_10250 [Candidatus Thorarchaeota archaeon]
MWIIIISIAFWGVIILYVLFWLGVSNRRPPVEDASSVSSSERLFKSKVYDSAFFDGESEHYAESVSRLRQYGGA